MAMWHLCDSKHYICLFFSVKIPSNIFAMPFQFQRSMDVVILRAVEHGFVGHFQRRCMAALVEEFSNAGESTPISAFSYYAQGCVEDLHFAFFCYCIGVGIAVFSLIGEFLASYDCLKRGLKQLCKNCWRKFKQKIFNKNQNLCRVVFLCFWSSFVIE